MSIAVRKYPFPYRAALAINNDTDGMDWQAFEDWHAFTNGELGLEVTDSFWVWAADGSFALQHGMPWQRDLAATPETDRIVELAQAGLLDTLHSYGDWPCDYDLNRGDIDHALALLDRHNLRPRAWVNHGGGHLRGHNMGGAWATYQGGDNPAHPSYSLRDLQARGVRYFWLDALFDNDRVSADVQLPEIPPVQIRRWGSVNDRDSGTRADVFPGASADDKQLLGKHYHESLLTACIGRDSTPFWGFKRYRGHEAPTVASLPLQLSNAHLDALVADEASAVIYQHMGVWRALGRAKRHASQRNSTPPVFDEGAQWALRDLADRYHSGRLLVAGTARLLDYHRMRDHLRYTIEDHGDRQVITIHSIACPIEGERVPTMADLMGLAFQMPRSTGEVIMVLAGSTTPLPTRRESEPGGDAFDCLHLPWQTMPWIAPKKPATARPAATTETTPPVPYARQGFHERLTPEQVQTLVPLVHQQELARMQFFSSTPSSLRTISDAWDNIQLPELFADANDYVKKMHAWPVKYYYERLRQITEGGGTVLDAGCGTASWSIPMGALFKNVIAIDRNRPRVDVARWLVQKSGLKNIEVEHGDITALKQDENSIDLVFCYGVVISYLSLRTVLHEFYRVMKPGATVYMCINGRGWSKYLRDERAKQNPKHRITGLRGLYNSICQSTHELLNDRLSQARLQLTQPAMLTQLGTAVGLDGAALKKLLATLQTSVDAAAVDLSALGATDDASKATALAKFLDTLLAITAQQGASLATTLEEVRTECAAEFDALFTTDLLNLFSGRKDGFSHANAGREYQPEEVEALCAEVGLEGFQWAREGGLMLNSKAKKQTPVFPGDFGGDLAVWEFVATKPKTR